MRVMMIHSLPKLAALSVLLALSLPVGAAETPGAGDETRRQAAEQKMKARVLEHIEAKIRVLQAARSCVRAAADVEAMAVCHAQERKQMKDIRDKERQGFQAGPR